MQLSGFKLTAQQADELPALGAAPARAHVSIAREPAWAEEAGVLGWNASFFVSCEVARHRG